MSATARHIVNPTGMEEVVHLYHFRRFADNEIEACINVIHEAFGKKYFYSVLGQKEELSKEGVRAHLMSGVIGGEIHVVELPEVGIVAVAMWFRPGQKFLSTPEQRAAGWDSLMDKLGGEISTWWHYFLQFISDMPEKYYGAGVQFDSYHLQLLGVHPEYQKKGYGTALFEFVEPRATAESRSIVLETTGESAVPFYKGLGYVIFGPESIKRLSGEIGFNAYWFQKKFVCEGKSE